MRIYDGEKGWFVLHVEDMPDDLRDAYLQVQMAQQHFRRNLKDELCREGRMSPNQGLMVSFKKERIVSFSPYNQYGGW